MSDETSYLFAMPSALEGAGRILDLGATMDFYNESASPADADAWAIERDWRAVGKDLFGAMRRFVAEEVPAS